MNIKTVKFRYIITLISNLYTSGIFFICSIILARNLSPSDFGEYQYLLNIFISFFTFFNFGTFAFFTFASQKKMPLNFYLIFGLWLMLQLLIPIVAILFLPAPFIYYIFLKKDRVLLIFAAFAAFISNHVKESINKLADSQRLTLFSQISCCIINTIHILLLIYFTFKNFITVKLIFILLTLEYIFYLLFALYFFFIKNKIYSFTYNLKIRNLLINLFNYCKPLFFQSCFVFLYMYFDRWYLQLFSGNIAQAHYGIARQFAKIAIIASVSLGNIYHKEIAEAIHKNNLKRVKMILDNVSNFLFIIAAGISFFLIPFSNEILKFLYTSKYQGALYPFVITLFFPVIQVLGQIYGAFFLATGHTPEYTKASITAGIFGIIMTLFFITPEKYFGLGLKATGLALKLVLTTTITTILLAYYINKLYKFKTNLFLKLIIGIVLLCFSYFLKFLLRFIFSARLTIILSGILYFSVLSIYIYKKYKIFLKPGEPSSK